MDALYLAPTALSALILAAHFLRRGQWVATGACLGLVALLFVPREWARRGLQLALLVAAAEWTRTMVELATARRAAGEPWVRMAVILGAVVALALVAIATLDSPRLRRRFARPPSR